MRITYAQLKQLPVKTVSGSILGKVKDLELDADSHQVLKYHVSEGFFAKSLLIAPNQIKSITAQAITVEDLLDKETAAETVERISMPKAVNPAIESEKN